MAAISWSDVVSLAQASEACAVDTRAQTVILEIVNGKSGPDPALFVDGENSSKLKLMRALYAAHISVTSPIGVSGGVVTSESASQLSRSYANISKPGTPYQESSYGRLFWQLMQSLGVRVGFVVTWGC